MELKGYLISPSSHFLKTLVNYCIENIPLNKVSASRYYIVFPTKRASLFFKFYLREKLNRQSFIIPKVLSWEEFLLEVYVYSSKVPYRLLPDEAKFIIFLPIMNQLGISWSEPEKLLFWSAKFVEVFEELEKEGIRPKNLYYPPEHLPIQAKSFFEKIDEAYALFTKLRTHKKILFPSDLPTRILEDHAHLDSFISSIKGLIFAGFVALRKAESEVIKLIISRLKLKAETIEPLFFFEDDYPPHRLIEKTVKDLGCELIPLDVKYLEKLNDESSIEVFAFPDPESETVYLRDCLSETQPQRPDEFAVILPDPTMIQAVLPKIQDFPLEVNITLPYKAKFLPINQLLQQILCIQREREENRYPLSSISKVISNPLLRLLFPDQYGNLSRIREVLENEIKNPERTRISIEELKEYLDPSLRPLLDKLDEPLFSIWEEVESPFTLTKALRKFLEFLKPLTGGEDLISILNGLYVEQILEKIEPIFANTSIWEDISPLSRNILLKILEILLAELELPLYGDPLAGLQILGFLEARLLSFKNIIVFDVNEGTLPPRPPTNPLLTDEIRVLLKLPIYRNEIWDYYFKNLIHSGNKITLLFVKAEKGQLAEEPSRFLQKLVWKSKKEKRNLEPKPISWKIFSPVMREFIPKTEDDKNLIFNMLKDSSISRYLIETYLYCPVRFYFKYILRLEEKNEKYEEDKEIGNFFHRFFEEFLNIAKNSDEGSFQRIAIEGWWRDLFEKIWEELKPDRFFDPLNAYIVKKIALTSVEKYLAYLVKCEKDSFLVENKVLETEKVLTYILPIKDSFLSDLNLSFIKLEGRVDLLVERKFRNSQIQVIAFDLKTNPNKNVSTKIISNLTSDVLKLTEEYTKETLYYARKLTASNLKNFQPLFYFFLLWHDESFLKNSKHLKVPNAGYITPTNFEKPESLIIPYSGRSLSPYKQGEILILRLKKFLLWIIKHMIFSESFYFIDDNCAFCSYQMPCRSLRIGG